MMMKRKFPRAACALLCCLVLASCGRAPEGGETAVAFLSPAVSTGPAASAEEPSETTALPADGEFARVVEAAAPVAREIAAEYGKVTGAIPEAEQERLLAAATALGVPAKLWGYGNGERGIEGWQAIADFCEAYRRGGDAETAWYRVDIEEVVQHRLVMEDGKLSREYRRWMFGDPSPSADATTVETLSAVKFREDGWLEWTRSPDEFPEQERIVPLPKELWGLCGTYVAPVAGDRSNVLTCGWDAENHGDVWWEFVFVSLSRAVGKELSETYEAVEDAYDTYMVPAADVEGLLTEYFPVTAEELRALPNYRPDRGDYLMQYFQGSGTFIGGDLEVTDRTDNPDGSMTLQVYWVRPDDWSGRYFLMVLPGEDGSWKYLGNRVEPDGGE